MSYKVIAIASTLFLFASHGFCQPFTDNFDDGQLYDGNPVQWEINPGQPNTATITDGNLIVTDIDGGDDDPVLFVQGDWKDVTIQTQFKSLTLDTTVGIFGRSQPGPPSPFYGTAISYTGILSIYEGFEDRPFEVVASTASGISQTRLEGDVVLQLKMLGDTITASVWETGSPENITELSIIDDSITLGGGVGLTVAHNDTGAVSFRSFSVVPEPSCTTLLLVGMICLAGWSRTKARLSQA